jgi:hypothetical protein
MSKIEPLQKARQQKQKKACVDGVDTTLRTTIDYVLVPSEQEDRTISLRIDDESGLDSDHRPLLLDTLWRPGPRCGPGTQRVTPRWERWCVADASEKDWVKYAGECNVRMSKLGCRRGGVDRLAGSDPVGGSDEYSE